MSATYRAYDKIREIIERHGGTMVYEREGRPPYGAWVISLGGNTKVIPATGDQSFEALDRLYVPTVVHPTRWDHRRNELLDDAEEVLLAFVKSPPPMA